MTPQRMDIVRREEWEAWRQVVAALRTAGAVTDADCESLETVDPTTPGLQVLAAIREWGTKVTALMSHPDPRWNVPT